MSKSTGNIILVEVGKGPRMVESGLDLEAFQAHVGGYIQVLTLSMDRNGAIGVYFNEEGRLKGMAPNALIPIDERSYEIMGPCFIAATDAEGETVSLTNEQVERWMKTISRRWLRARVPEA